MSAPTRDWWNQVSPYLDKALDMSETDRASWLASLRETNPEIAGRLEELLREHEALREKGFLEQGVPLTSQPGLAGQTIGPYKLLSAIGHGGMGSVWLGERSDGRFERRVAVKFLSVALVGHGGEERFKREGSILGRLEHPHIAELLDAGISETGCPYLVLEHVDGQPVDAYCDQHQLSVQDRVKLFLDVLAAVAHAHANLIVHRDLKPSNVLVSNDGQVKLLDFGIAKLLEEGSAGSATLLTQEHGGALTPQYAAPEQVIGGPVTTATDVYALGVLLYVLLTGQHPIGPGAQSTAELVKAIVDVEPPRASDVVMQQAATDSDSSAVANRSGSPEKLSHLLRGDLDTIVGKALKKDPKERYPSVTALADDLRRYLANQPIAARPDTLTYRTAKFVRRNKLVLSLTTAAILVIVGSLSAGLYVANRERKIAERRFLQVRQLANKYIELDDDIRGFPGSTKVRSQIVADSLQYLTSLGSEAHVDKDLANEIALAYVRVAHVQGDPTSPNLGQFAEAEESLNKAEKFLNSVLAADPRNHDALACANAIPHDRMVLAYTQGRGADGLFWADKTVASLDRFVALGNLTPRETYGATYVYSNVAWGYATSRHFEDAVRTAQRALQMSQAAPSARRMEGAILELLGYALWQSGQLEKALETFHRAIPLLEQAATTGHAAMKSNLVEGLWRQGMLLGRQDAEPSLDRPTDALISLQRAMYIAEELAKKDPDDNMSRHEVAEVGVEIGNILRHTNPRKALSAYDHSLGRIRELKGNAATRLDEVELLAGSSYAVRWLGRNHEAKQRIDMAFQLLRDTHQYPSDKIEPMSAPDHVLRALADHYAESGQTPAAIETYEELLGKLNGWKLDVQNDLRDATCISRTWTALAALDRRVGRAEQADRLEASRTELWTHWKEKLPNGDVLLRQSLRQTSRGL